jgi:hypothetical protein
MSMNELVLFNSRLTSRISGTLDGIVVLILVGRHEHEIRMLPGYFAKNFSAQVRQVLLEYT